MGHFALESSSRLPRVPVWAVAIVTLWLAGIAAIRLLGGGGVPTLCHLRRTTGVPCPTCGTTRATTALLGGDFGTAIAHNPLMVSVAAASFDNNPSL